MQVLKSLFCPLFVVVILTACGGGKGNSADAVNAFSATANTTWRSLTVGIAMDSFSPISPNNGVAPYSYSYTGILPEGLSFNSNSGVVSGTPTSAYSTAKLVFSVKDANNHVASNTSSVGFTVDAAPFYESTLNDTGITSSLCYETGGVALVACNSAGALALNNAQDGMIGRDANSTTNSDTDGKQGFSFTAVTGGCVLDNVTGLMWEVKTNDGGLRDWNNTYTNYGDNSVGDASTFLAAVNASTLCGYGDWRAPSVDELQSIVDYSVIYPGPMIDSTWFPNSQGNWFWSSTPYASGYPGNWGVNFYSGIISYGKDLLNSTISTHYVRLVRAGKPAISPRYVVAVNGQEVRDNQTNLVWRRCAEGMQYSGGTCTGFANMYSHENALKHASDEAIAAGVGWRVPNIKELTSIADKTLINPALDATAFPATPTSSPYWSSTPPNFCNSCGTPQSVYFYNGSATAGGKYLRLVRSISTN